MGRRCLSFTFEREAKWLVVLYVLLPLILILFATVIPRISEAMGPPRSFLRCVGCSVHAGEDLPGPLPSEARAPH